MKDLSGEKILSIKGCSISYGDSYEMVHVSVYWFMGSNRIDMGYQSDNSKCGQYNCVKLVKSSY